MIRLEIPRHYYASTLADSVSADAIEAEVEPPANGERGRARLKLWPLSGKLTNIHVSVSIPRSTIGAPSASPWPIDLTASLPGTRSRCAWRHGGARKNEPVTYETPFTTSSEHTLRFEFRVRTDQLKRPAVLTVDLAMPAAQGGGSSAPPEQGGQGGAG